jgi:hypothetical protein
MFEEISVERERERDTCLRKSLLREREKETHV